MTRLFVASDLHVDWHKDWGKGLIQSMPTDVDVAVIAGDVCESHRLDDILSQLAEHFNEVVYVPGNHEYYGSDWTNVENQIRDVVSKYHNFTWLDDDRVKIAGLNFIGSTLWFPDSVAAQINKRYLSDYSTIMGFEPHVYTRNAASIGYLEYSIEPGDIVVTHHTPSYQSVTPKFKGHTLNCYFHNRLDKMIHDKKPALWCHGHTHGSLDYTMGDTRIVCNPHGYRSENPFFKKDFIIDI